MSNFAVQLASEILELKEENERLKHENFQLRAYRDKYNELLGQSVAHGEKMMGGILELLLTKDITDRPEPIPEGITYNPENDNFYDEMGNGMGETFYHQWWVRRNDFLKDY